MAGMSYYIYIKGEGNSGYKPTKPKPSTIKPTTETPIIPSTKNFFGGFVKGAIASLTFYATVKIATRAVQATASYMSKQTGDFVFQRNLNNFLTTFSVFRNPLSTVVSLINQEQEIRLTNQRMEESRVLLGDSLISQGTRKV